MSYELFSYEELRDNIELAIDLHKAKKSPRTITYCAEHIMRLCGIHASVVCSESGAGEKIANGVREAFSNPHEID